MQNCFFGLVRAAALVALVLVGFDSAADVPSTTVAGNTFVLPAGWTSTVKGNATLLQSPEGNSWIALVDVKARQHDAAIAEAWAAYRPDARRVLLGTASSPDKDGWTDQRTYSYQTSASEHRSVGAGVMRHGDRWLAWIADLDNGVREKRLAAIALIFDTLLPKGYTRETFAGRKANVLDDKRLRELTEFIERSRQTLDVQGMSLGLVQNGRTVFAGGFGVKDLSKPDKPDADTLYLIASSTKPLTTLMLAKLVDQKQLTWDAPVTSVLPQFKLGDAATTRKVQIKHLLCACTGVPRQDLEWLMEFEHATAASSVASLAKMQPTSDFGEIFQYSNPLAAAAGYAGGHVMFPDRELGAAYDAAMQSLVFDPLGMSATTFDFKRALAGNHASAHALDIDGKPAHAAMDVNYAVVPMRPAGGAWSSINDMLKYVSMELANGKLPDGTRYISPEVLSQRRAPNVPISRDDKYAMGLFVSTIYGLRAEGHNGSMMGYRSHMRWLPDHGVGIVMLTNSDEGWSLTSAVERKILELLFDAESKAEKDVAVAATATRERVAAQRKLLTVPPDKSMVAQLADHYTSPELGDIAVRKEGTSVIFDLGEWQSPVASRKDPDGTASFVTIVPGFSGKEFVTGSAGGKRVLKLRDAQHEYVFHEK